CEMKANDFVKLILRSPLHGLAGNTMLITISGRKSGKPITIPVKYCRNGNTLWILSTRTRKWWRNIPPGSRVQVHLHGRELVGTVKVLLDEAAVAAQLGEYVQQLPAAAGSLGLRSTNGVPHPDDVARLARERLFVRVCIEDSLN
ncbi:MAG: nitroreductase/quinone reductase family protein, partial [Chloroflexota bacterium]